MVKKITTIKDIQPFLEDGTAGIQGPAEGVDERELVFAGNCRQARKQTSGNIHRWVEGKAESRGTDSTPGSLPTDTTLHDPFSREHGGHGTPPPQRRPLASLPTSCWSFSSGHFPDRCGFWQTICNEASGPPKAAAGIKVGGGGGAGRDQHF